MHFVVLYGERNLSVDLEIVFHDPWADREGGGWARGPDPTSLKNHKNIGFLSNIGLDLLKNHKAIKPAFTNGVSLAGR